MTPVLTIRYTQRACYYECRDPVLMAGLEAFLTIRNPKYDNEKKYDEHAVEYVRLIDAERRLFLSGAIERVLRWLGKRGLVEERDFQVYDRPARVNYVIDPAIVPGITLRPDQVKAVEACLRERSGVVEVATGGGKTEIAIAVVLAKRRPKTIFSVPDTTALREMRARFLSRGFAPEQVGRFGEGIRELDAQVVVATVASLYSGLKRNDAEVIKLLADVKLFICDECFSAGTLVDGRKIEDVRAGDLVRAWDEKTARLVGRRVTSVMRRRPHRMVRVFVGDDVISCTADHPFWTQRGWLRASDLTQHSMVLSYGHGEPILEAEAVRDALCVVRGASARRDEKPTGVCQTPRKGVLLGGTQAATPIQGQFRADVSDESETLFCAHEVEQPHASGGAPREDGQGAQAQEDSSDCSGREWSRNDSPGGTTVGGDRANSSDSSYSTDPEVDRMAHPLQSGSGGACPEAGGGGGWGLTPQSQGSGEGSKEGVVSTWARVDCVEVLEPGCDGSFGGVCSDGYVYNLEVEGAHTYLVGKLGIVVHNCHHAATADSWRTVLGATDADRIALSGTALNEAQSRGTDDIADPYDAMLLGIFGPTLALISLRHLIDLKAATNLWVVPYEGGGKTVSAAWSNWQQVYNAGVVNNEDRTSRIALLVANISDAGYWPLISIEQLRHGRVMQDRLLRRYGRYAVCAYGDGTFVVPREIRHIFRGVEFRDIHKQSKAPLPIEHMNTGRSMVEKDFVCADLDDVSVAEFDTQLQAHFRAGRVHVLIGSRIYNEVINIKFLTDLVNAPGGRASKTIRQKWGRVVRLSPETHKTLAVAWDPYDTNHHYLKHQSEKRIAIARSERLDVRMLAPVELWFRLRDLARVIVRVRRDSVRIREVEVTASLSFTIGVPGGSVTVSPSVSLRADLDVGEDERVAAEKLGVRAVGALLRESVTQSHWGMQAASVGPMAAVAAHAANYASAPTS